MLLLEEHLLRRSVHRDPISNPTLQRAEQMIVVLAWVLLLKPAEDAGRLQRALGVSLEERDNLRVPDGGERVDVRPPRARCLGLRRQRSALPPPCGPLAHRGDRG